MTGHDDKYWGGHISIFHILGVGGHEPPPPPLVPVSSLLTGGSEVLIYSIELPNRFIPWGTST